MRPTASVLGEVRIHAQGASIDLGGPRQRRLLAALLVHRGSTVSMDRLVEVTFDGQPPDAAWRTFRTYVARLRRALDTAGLDGSAVVVTVPSGYALSTEVEIDADRFEEAVRSARDELDVGDAETALGTVEEALTLWTGSAYGEFADEEWARPDAIRLEELRVVGRELHAAAMVETGRHDEAIAEIRALTESEPLREEPRRLLMLALYRTGRHAEALRAGREFRALLAEETGLEWSSSLAELEQMIIARDPRLDRVPRGRKLRGYVLGEVLAETPHGTTYRASQPAIGRDVAITVIPAELADDAAFVHRFERHAQRIAAIEHPAVVPLYDYWREPGGAYLVSRHLLGGTLAARLAGKTTITPDDATRIIDEIGSALSAAAERGVAHGRLTADAVQFDEAGRAHVTGFGVDEIDHAPERDITALAELARLLWSHVTTPVATGDGGHGDDGRGDDGRGDDSGSRPRSAELVDAVVARSTDPTGGYADLDELIEALAAASRGRSVPAAAVADRAAIEGPNPYRGLHAFRESDAEVFFGRRAMVDQLAADLRRDSFLALVGPSGSGKSSVVRAGLLAQVRSAGAFVASMVPGNDPVAELEIALSRVAATPVPDLADALAEPGRLVDVIRATLPDADARLVLCIDQLEEAVTMSDPGGRDAVFAALARAVRDGGGVLRVVVTLRADFLGRILDDPVFGPLVRDHSRLITPLDSDELYEAIVEPAAIAGVAVEPELATALVADAIDSPGSLPLLQFALTELYEHRTDGTMTLETYRRMGGLTAPIAQRAEEVHSSLSADDRDAARRLFARLITLGEGSEDTRRRVLRSELATVPQPVLDVFGAARLLTFDRDPRTREPTVEIAHEALIRGWPRLRSWVDDDRAGLLVLRHLTTSSAAWDAAGRDPSELYRGSRLATAEEWAADRGAELTPLEHDFLAAGRAARDAELERDRRRARRLRALAIGLAVVAVLAVIAGGIAVVQRDRADANAREAQERTVEAEEQRRAADANAREAQERTVEAEEQRQIADASAQEAEAQTVAANVQRLTAEANNTLDEDPDLPILLALEAYDQSRQLAEDPPGSLMATMQTAVQSSRVLLETTDVGEAGAISPDGGTFAARALEDDGVVVLVDADNGDEIRRLVFDFPITAIAFGPAGERLAIATDNRAATDPTVLDVAGETAPEDGEVVLVDAVTSEVLDRRASGCCATRLGFGPDGRFLAAFRESVGGVPFQTLDLGPATGLATLIWDLEEPGRPAQTLPGSIAVGWTSDGTTYVTIGDGAIQLVDARTGESRRSRPTISDVRSVDLAPDGERLAAVRAALDIGAGSKVEIWPIGGREPTTVDEDLNPTVRGGGGPVRPPTAVRFTPDGSRLALYGTDDEVRLIRSDTGAAISLPGNRGTVSNVDFSDDGSRLLALGTNGTYLWDITPSGPRELGNLPTEGDPTPVRFTADGSGLVVEEVLPTGIRVRALDLVSGAERASTGIRNSSVELSDGGVIAIGARGPDVAGHVEQPDDPSLEIPLDPCFDVAAIDSAGRRLVLSPQVTEYEACLFPSRIVDPASGELVLDLETRVLADPVFGRAGTPAEGLVVAEAYFFEGDEVALAIEVWDAVAGVRIESMRDEGEELRLPSFSADGRYITFGSRRSGAYAVDLEQVLDGVPMREAIVLNPRGVGGVTTFADVGGDWLVAGQSGEVLRFYDLETGVETMTLSVDTVRSTNVAFTPDGSALYYEANNGLLRRFPMDHTELADLARERVQRDFTAEECERFAIPDCSE